jgi:transposase InsO family protein
MATLHRSPRPGLSFHSDRGVQYASSSFRAALEAAGITPSMSRRGNCYDNAAMESFWSTLKLELVYRRCFSSRHQAKAEIFYNRKRNHTALGGLSPALFESQNP